MITTTRLHGHEFDLLPLEAAEAFSAMVAMLHQSTIITGNSASDNGNSSSDSATSSNNNYPVVPLYYSTTGGSHDDSGDSSGSTILSRLFAVEKMKNGLAPSSKFHSYNLSGAEIMDMVVQHRRTLEKVFVPSAEMILVCVYVFLMAWGIVSNCLVCFVVTKQCSRKTIANNGPSPRNLYIVNLAIADFLLCVVCMPFTLVSLLRRRWTLGVLLCKLVPIAQGANIIVSSGTIAAIAFDRYFTIVRSPRGPMCRFSVATTLVLIWMISLASLLPTCLYQHMEVLAVGDVIIYELCVEKWPSAKMQKIYTILLAALQFALPVIVLSIIHIKISMYLNVHLSTAKPTNDFSKRVNRELRRNRKTMWILSCIAIVFAVSWLPLTVFTLIVEFQPSLIQSSRWMYLSFCVCHILAMSSAGTNPLLYGYLNTNFRRDLTNLLYGVFRIEKGSTRSKKDQYNNRGNPNSKTNDGMLIHKEGKSAATNVEAVSLVVRSRDRRTSSSFGTTLTSVLRGRSSSFGLTQHKIDEL